MTYDQSRVPIIRLHSHVFVLVVNVLQLTAAFVLHARSRGPEYTNSSGTRISSTWLSHLKTQPLSLLSSIFTKTLPSFAILPSILHKNLAALPSFTKNQQPRASSQLAFMKKVSLPSHFAFRFRRHKVCLFPCMVLLFN